MLSDTLKEKIEESLPAILSIQETADFFSVAYLTVYRLIRMGKLPAWKDDEGNWCIARSDLITFCSKNSNL
jgi:excisionase family DNA binding protein